MSASHVFLIGYRGCGKSTVGRLLAAQIDWTFVDTDDMVENAAGSSIQEIFAREGEGSFREWEQRAVASAAARELPTIISLGGGAILREANQQQIREFGQCVWLKGSAESLYARIRGDASSQGRRPNLTSSDGFTEVVELLAAREPIYADLADLKVDTDGRQPDEIVADIAGWLKEIESH